MNHKTNICFALLAFTCCFQTKVAAQYQTAYTVSGIIADDRTSTGLGAAGDVNKDGYDDVIIGTPNDDFNGANSGRATIISGKDGTTLYNFYGDSAQDLFGHSVAGAGDIDGDGFDDVIVGIPLDDNQGIDSGAARIFSGFDGSILATLNGALAGDYFGISVDSAGDVNNDGIPDLIVGALYNDLGATQGGMVRVFSGSNFAILHEFLGSFSFQSMGIFVSGAGDTNNDGYDDIVMGSAFYGGIINDGGKAELRSGFDGSLLFEWFGTGNRDFFGTCVDGGMDVNGDGYDDVVVGAPGSEVGIFTPGYAKVYSGFDGTELHNFTGSMPGSRMGYSVALAGDLNNDGFADILVGSPRDDATVVNTGRAYFFSGFDGSSLFHINGNLAGDEMGFALSAAGDVNRDGFPDVVIGATYEDSPALDGGRAYIITSPTLPVLHYSTTVLPEPPLLLTWAADGGNIQSATGTIRCTGASSFGLGLAGISLAPGEFLIYGMSCLIAIDPINLLDRSFFGFDINGQLIVPGVSRISPFIAGSLLHIQFFEYFPNLSSSTAVRLRIDP